MPVLATPLLLQLPTLFLLSERLLEGLVCLVGPRTHDAVMGTVRQPAEQQDRCATQAPHAWRAWPLFY